MKLENDTSSPMIARIFFILASIFFITISLTLIPTRAGDAYEYLGMTVSFANHGTAQLTQQDIDVRAHLSKSMPGHWWDMPPEYYHSGYYHALNGREYSFHFWGYSLLCALPYLLLNAVGMNPLKAFQVTNALLFLFLLWWILFRAKLSDRSKLWLILVTLVSPVLFYLPWCHPEVYSFVFLLIGLIELMSERAISASYFIAIASLQNPPILLVNGVLFLGEFFKTRKVDRKLLFIAGSFLVAAIPFLFYWIYYRKFSLIAGTFASTDAITVRKICGLFFDLNFGLVVYVPMLLLLLVWLIYKRNLWAIVGTVLLISMATVSATQQNWNGGMMYIHRYCILLLPILIVATLPFIGELKQRSFLIISFLYLLTTETVLITCYINYDDCNYIRFSPLAQFAMATAPSLYNPPPEVFAERVMCGEAPFKDQYLALTTSQGLRKALYFDPTTGAFGYLNGPLNLPPDLELTRLKFSDSAGDIVSGADKLNFGRGWYNLEKNDKSKQRWTSEDSELIYISNAAAPQATIKIAIKSFMTNRRGVFYVNNSKIEKLITPEPTEITLPVSLNQGINCLRIHSKDGAQAPSDVQGSNNGDPRPLAFCIFSVQVEK
jgi:hypothetical protein